MISESTVLKQQMAFNGDLEIMKKNYNQLKLKKILKWGNIMIKVI
jgi:hypothetical protein